MGNWNTGDFNTGDGNTGDFNAGNRNTGDFNAGNGNTGYRNAGNWNTGDINTGDINTGGGNTGGGNTGNRNAGNLNAGSWNAGNWNTGDRNVGHFNTATPSEISVFNKPCSREVWNNAEKPRFLWHPSPATWVASVDMTDEEKRANPGHTTTGGYLRTNDMREEWAKAYARASDHDKSLLFALPNFDADVFKEITGIDVCADILADQSKKDRVRTTINVNGRTYELVE
jgi:hypothetical protein